MGRQFESWRQVVEEAAVGDPDATELMAERLAEQAASSEQVGQLAQQRATEAEQQYRRATGKIEYERAVRALARTNGWEHMVPGSTKADPDYTALVTKLEAENLNRYPNMTDIQRAAFTFEQVEKIKGPLDQSGNAEWFAERRRRADPFAEKGEQLQFNEDQQDDPEYDEEKARYGEGVAAMIQGREQLQHELAERAIAQRDAPPPKPRYYSNQR